MQKQGSSTVFLAVVLACLMSITLTLVFAGRMQAQISIADGALDLASVSLLSEYDYYVQQDYGLFLLRGTDAQLSADLRDYTRLSAKASASRFCLVNTDEVRTQILEYMKAGGAVHTISEAIAGEDAAAPDAPQNAGGENPDGTVRDRTLRHGPTITSLPSRAVPDSDIVTTARKLGESLTNPEAIFRTGSNKFFITEYILQKFNRTGSIRGPDHFFGSEVEYIISGKRSDVQNKRQTDLALEAVRSGLNLTHIYSDPEKMSLVAAAAETITPGPLGAVTQFAIAAAWSAAEAVNDVKLLHKGRKVPLVKTAASWAIDLDTVLEGYSGEDGCVYPQVNTGRTYEDYLRILLYAKDDTIKTARILDLIQINMRKNHDEAFLIQECATGVSVSADVNGKTLSRDRIY